MAAKTPRERRHRAQRLYSVLGRARPVIVPPDQAVGAARATFRTSGKGYWSTAWSPLGSGARDFDAVVEKFVRGLHYHRAGTVLSATAKVIAFDPPKEAMEVAAGLEGGEQSAGLLYRFFHAAAAAGGGAIARAFWRNSGCAPLRIGGDR